MKIDYTRYYLKWHSEAPGQAPNTAFHKRLLAPHLPRDLKAKVLDVGCGMGQAMLALKELGYSTVSGVEVDEGQHRACLQRGLDVTLATDTAEFLRNKVGEYDVILALDVFEHIPTDAQLTFVTAIAKALKPDGKLICTVPNANSALAARWRYNDWTHHSSFTEHSIDFLLYNAGFRDIAVFPAEFIERPRIWWLPISGARHWWAFRFFRFLRRLEMMAELGPDQGRAVPLSLNILATATKSAA